MEPDRVLVVCGLNREASLAAGPGIRTIAGGGDREALEARLRATDLRGIAAIVSFGLCGGLDPGLCVGDLVLPSVVLDRDGRAHPVATELVRRASARLGAAGEAHRSGRAVGVDRPALDRSSKRLLRDENGADIVDMESHVSALFAAERSLPFGVLRIVSDSAEDSLPPAAAIAMRPDGSIALAAVLGSLVRHPDQLPALVRTGRNAGAAFRRLGRVGGLLGDLLGLDL